MENNNNSFNYNNENNATQNAFNDDQRNTAGAGVSPESEPMTNKSASNQNPVYPPYPYYYAYPPYTQYPTQTSQPVLPVQPVKEPAAPIVAEPSAEQTNVIEAQKEPVDDTSTVTPTLPYNLAVPVGTPYTPLEAKTPSGYSSSAPFAQSLGAPVNAPTKKERKSHSTDSSKKRFSFLQLIAAVLIATILAGGVMTVIVNGKINSLVENTSSSGSVAEAGSSVKKIVLTGQSLDESVSAVAEKVSPSVVGIKVTTTTNNWFYGTGDSQSEGSGVIYTADGYIITNYHVISSAVETASSSYGSVYDFFGGGNATPQQENSQSKNQSSVDVYLNSDGETSYPAEIVGYDASADLAVLKIEANGLTPIELGNSDDISVGDTSIAVGCPGGLDFMGSVSKGIISGLNRTIVTENGSEMNLIQTDAAINPGNSGGALCDSEGKLIGINNSKMSGSDYEGMGFAIPINTVREVCTRLIENKDNPQPYIGILASSQYTSDVLERYGFPAGVLVEGCVSGSPAEDAGIKSYDIITAINGVEITSFDALNSEKNKYVPGDTISLTVYREGQNYTVQLVLGTTN